MNSKVISLYVETPHKICRALSVTSVLTGTYRVDSILTLLKTRLQALVTAQNASVMASCGCSMVKSKAIGSTWSRFTPTEPNWTEKPAVINYGDIQHFSGKVA